MEATKDHISLETAKLLKNCGVESGSWWILYKEGKRNWEVVDRDMTDPNEWTDFYPAYTWQEILWEYPEQFFSEEITDMTIAPLGIGHYADIRHIIASNIVRLLQKKAYNKADQYFRKNCVLINKQ